MYLLVRRTGKPEGDEVLAFFDAQDALSLSDTGIASWSVARVLAEGPPYDRAAARLFFNGGYITLIDISEEALKGGPGSGYRRERGHRGRPGRRGGSLPSSRSIINRVLGPEGSRRRRATQTAARIAKIGAIGLTAATGVAVGVSVAGRAKELAKYRKFHDPAMAEAFDDLMGNYSIPEEHLKDVVGWSDYRGGVGHMPGVLGLYDQVMQTVYVNPNTLDPMAEAAWDEAKLAEQLGRVRPSLFDRVSLHELGHHVTGKAVSNLKNNDRVTQMSRDLRDANLEDEELAAFGLRHNSTRGAWELGADMYTAWMAGDIHEKASLDLLAQEYGIDLPEAFGP